MLQPQEMIQLQTDESLAYRKPKKLVRDIDRPTFMEVIV